MKPTTYLRLSTALTGAGTAFSGYLSTIRVSSGVCAFAEPCPFFLGYPACYTGLLLFVTMFVVSALSLARRSQTIVPAVANAIVSALGVAFAGRMVAVELDSPVHQYKLGLPTCAYGLVFFVAVLIASLLAWLRRPKTSP